MPPLKRQTLTHAMDHARERMTQRQGKAAGALRAVRESGATVFIRGNLSHRWPYQMVSYGLLGQS
jgi:hypothetical protein